ncbi:competence protein CoiA [Cytobacillus sp. NCCP-133]|uniref:competence protein CoiA n=1 Tax=Cytobacillus sp. NCCP-133 TaxID=766848 RepID=UPI00222FEF79|nr:competence protein CoiA family protein [Cytobacillus sp. NCCP-133]GLB58918.1 hypothetical protein NCCP133_10510 [Cytobacillus sp. NCCP-133]
MLVAHTNEGERVNLAENQDLLTLKRLRKQTKFFCPECSEEVIMKVGTKRIPHYSHNKGSSCTESYERESEYHSTSKLILLNWLKEKGLNPVLEPYYPDIAQRPDIGVRYKGIDYAIEFQCSIISEELFAKRSRSYFQSGIIPIWILAGKNISRIGNNKISLSGFHYLFLRKTDSDNWVIPSFCPITKSFINIHHIVPITVKNAFSTYQIKPLNKADLSTLFCPKFHGQISKYEWYKELRKTKDFLPQTRGAFKNKFLRELYTHSLSPIYLPPEVGLPVFQAPLIETSPIQWQSYLFMDVLKEENPFSLEKVISCFHKRVYKNDIKIRRLPLVCGTDASFAVKEYLNLLVNLKVLAKEGGLYKRSSPYSIHESQSWLLRKEEAFYHEKGMLIMEGIKQPGIN